MLPNEPDPGFEPGFEPIFFAYGRACFRAPPGERIPAPRSGALENFWPQNRVFTPHFLSKITSIRVVYGVNRNLLIEFFRMVPSNRCESVGKAD